MKYYCKLVCDESGNQLERKFNYSVTTSAKGESVVHTTPEQLFAWIDTLKGQIMLLMEEDDLTIINRWTLEHLKIRNIHMYINKEGKKVLYDKPSKEDIKAICWYIQDEDYFLGANYRNANQAVAYFRNWNRIYPLKEVKVKISDNSDITSESDINPLVLDILKSWEKEVIEEMKEFNKHFKIGPKMLTINGYHWKKFKKAIDFNFDGRYKNQISPETYNELSKWKIGARVQERKGVVDAVKRKAITFDINAMYTFIALNAPMPFGPAIRGCVPGECKHLVSFISIDVIGKIKPRHIPSICVSKAINRIEQDHWAETLGNSKKGEYETLYLTVEEWATFKDDYDWEYVDVYNPICFETYIGINNEYVNALIRAKEGSIHDEKWLPLYKGGLNTNWGHFVGKLRDTSLEYVKTKKGMELVEFPLDPDFIDVPYAPVGLAIYSYARIYLGETIRKYADKFVSCKTDSITLFAGTEFKEPIDEVKTGYWKGVK